MITILSRIVSGQLESARQGDGLKRPPTQPGLIGAGAILAAYLVLGLACGLVIPPFENLDEIEHLGVVWYIVDTGRLPVHGTPAAEVYHYRQEASQPPLYYLLSAGLARALGLRADDLPDFWRFNDWVACGPQAPSLYNNRAIFYHNPNREAFPWHGTLLMLHTLRAWSTLLQAITVAGTYALARMAFPQRRWAALLAMAIVAFNPQFLLVASGVNNDNLVTPLATLGLLLLGRIWQRELSARRVIVLGVIGGLAGLSKLSGWLLLVLAMVVILIIICRSSRRRIAKAAGFGALLALPALAVGGWWFWRNWRLYGDPTALKPMLALVGGRKSPFFNPLFEGSLMFRSFWGQIACSFYPSAFYILYSLLTAIGIGGLILGWRRMEKNERIAVLALAAWFLLIVAGWARWDMITPAPGGRLLFPALPAVALLLALGVETLTRGRLKAICGGVAALLALSALWSTAWILPAFYAPPPRYNDADRIQPDHLLDATLGDAVRLLGYDLVLNDKGPTLDLTLYWQSAAATSEDYVVSLQLVSPVPGDNTLRWNYNSWPGQGNYPTSAWQLGEIIADRGRFPLPAGDLATQAWDLHLILFQRETGARLPARIEGAPAGDHLVLARLRVPGNPPNCPQDGQLTAEARFGDAVALTHASVVPQAKDTLVTLCWESLQPLDSDYTVFVHLTDETGLPIVTGDGPPMNNAFPTGLWRPGDVILDIHRLPAAGAGGQRIAVGLYNPADGSRLPASVNNVSTPDAAITIWPDRP